MVFKQSAVWVRYNRLKCTEHYLPVAVQKSSLPVAYNTSGVLYCTIHRPKTFPMKHNEHDKNNIVVLTLSCNIPEVAVPIHSLPFDQFSPPYDRLKKSTLPVA